MRIEKSVKVHGLKWLQGAIAVIPKLVLICVLIFVVSCGTQSLDEPTPSENQMTELQDVVTGLGQVEEVLRSIDSRLYTSIPNGEQAASPDGEQAASPDGEQAASPDGEQAASPDGEQAASLSDIVNELGDVKEVLESIDSRLAETSGTSEQSIGDEWRRTRDDASKEMRAVIDALAKCRVEGGYDVNDDGGKQVREWVKEAAWREATIYPERNNVSYWANLLPFSHCATEDIEY